MAYTKLDSGITDSTIWQAPDTTRIVWITMLAMADQNGYVGASMPGLAGRARVSLDACIEAVETFLAPDKWSRTKDNEGRRITEAEGGWVLLNHAQYRATFNAEKNRERARLGMADLRARRKAGAVTRAKRRKRLPDVSGGDPQLRKLVQAEADTDTDIALPLFDTGNIGGGSAQSADPPPPPPEFTGLNADTLNGKAIVPLSPAFKLCEEWGTSANALGWTPSEALREAEKFRQYWTQGTGQGTRRSVKGWRQSWSNWLAKAAKEKQR